MNKEKLQATAKAAFEKLLRDKVEFISARCWPVNLKNVGFEEINKLITAAKTLEVTTARQFTATEIDSLVAEITPLRTLEMEAETRTIVVSALSTLGIDPAIFPQTKSK
jgi:hypothetical protein